MSKEYPVEIYPKPNERIKDSAERIYDLGFEQGRLEGRREKLEPDTGWTRLTTTNPDWGRIDWAALYGRPTILTHSASFSVISTEIISKGPHTVGYDDGTREIPAHQALLLKAPPKMVHSALHGATQSALEGKDGWALYVCGDLPLRKLTADELAPGTCFRARYKKNGETHNYAWAQLLKPHGQKPRVIFFSMALTTLFGSALPENVEVVEVYGPGTFQTHKEPQQ